MACFPSILQWWQIKFIFAVIDDLILSHTHAFTHIWCTSVHYHPQQWSTCPVFGQLEPLQVFTQVPKSLGEDNKISLHHVWDWSLVKVKLKIHMEGFYPVKILFAQILENGSIWPEDYMSRDQIILLCRWYTPRMNITHKYALYLLWDTDTSTDPGQKSWRWTCQPHIHPSPNIYSLHQPLRVSAVRFYHLFSPNSFLLTNIQINAQV